MPTGQTAGAFLASRLLAASLIPLQFTDSTEVLENYYQYFDIVGMNPAEVQIHLSVTAAGKSLPFKRGEDYFYPFNSPRKITVNGEAVFAGYGIRAPEYQYDDLSGRELTGKVAVVFYGEPLETDTLPFFEGRHQTRYLLDEYKARALAQMGAKAILLVPTPENQQKYSRLLKRRSHQLHPKTFVLKDETGVPVIYLSAEARDRLMGDWLRQNFPAEIQRLKKWLAEKSGRRFQWKGDRFPAVSIGLSLDYQGEEVRHCRNVLAVLPGKDERLRREYILIGSHYDHEGLVNGQIYRGADDNASGDAANLGVARAYARLTEEQRPARSVLFAFWDAEEKGMLGSRYFVDHPPVDLSRIKTAINMDMIGRDASFKFMALRRPMVDDDASNKVMLFYSAQTPQLKDIALAANKMVGLHLLFDPNVFFTSGSDHANFQPRRIPVVYYFTGFHTDYTSPTDTPDKIDYQKLTKISRHIANLIYILANRSEALPFDSRILTAPEGDFRM